MNHRDDDQSKAGSPETDGAVDPADVEDLPDGSTPSTPGYEASRETLDQAEKDTDHAAESPA